MHFAPLTPCCGLLQEGDYYTMHASYAVSICLLKTPHRVASDLMIWVGCAYCEISVCTMPAFQKMQTDWGIYLPTPSWSSPPSYLLLCSRTSYPARFSRQNCHVKSSYAALTVRDRCETVVSDANSYKATKVLAMFSALPLTSAVIGNKRYGSE